MPTVRDVDPKRGDTLRPPGGIDWMVEGVYWDGFHPVGYRMAFRMSSCNGEVHVVMKDDVLDWEVLASRERPTADDEDEKSFREFLERRHEASKP